MSRLAILQLRKIHDVALGIPATCEALTHLSPPRVMSPNAVCQLLARWVPCDEIMRIPNVTWRLWRLVVMLGAMTALAIGGCGQSEDATWTRVQDTGTLRVGMDASFPPFESVTAEGALVGLDVDIVREISRRLDLEPQFVANLPFDGLYDALTAQRVDLLISALVVNPARRDDYAYSRPYFDAGQVLVGPTGEVGLGSMSELEDHRLAVVLGMEGDRVARHWERRSSELAVVQFRTAREALDSVRRGETDGALVDRVSALKSTGGRSGLAITGEGVTHVPYACAVRRESLMLLDAVNEALAAMEADGTMDALVSEWLR